MKFPPRCTHWHKERWAESYQKEVYLEALNYVKKRDLAVDLGAHVGIFTVRMERDFEEVYSFEPAPDNFRCLAENTLKARLFNCCAWDKQTLVGMRFEDHHNSGANEVFGQGKYPALPLDTFGLSPDLIKIDIQGSEVKALQGARETLKAAPVIIIEGDESSELLLSMGFVLKTKIGKDRIWTA